MHARCQHAPLQGLSAITAGPLGAGLALPRRPAPRPSPDPASRWGAPRAPNGPLHRPSAPWGMGGYNRQAVRSHAGARCLQRGMHASTQVTVPSFCPCCSGRQRKGQSCGQATGQCCCPCAGRDRCWDSQRHRIHHLAMAAHPRRKLGSVRLHGVLKVVGAASRPVEWPVRLQAAASRSP